MQPLSDPPIARELAQFLDPDGAAHSFSLEQIGDETTAHPTGQCGRLAIWFLGVICAMLLGGAGVSAAEQWPEDQALAVVLFIVLAGMGVAATWFMARFLR